MYTLVLASQKGGSGKTTLSGHLGVEAERCGAGPVALIDTDPQGSLALWWNAREADAPLFVRVGMLDLAQALEQLRQAGIRLCIIDTPPAITGAISQVVAHADLVLVPTRPSPHDLRAVGATVDIAERHNKPLIFIVNGATARARITGEAAIALSQHGTVAPVTLHHRVDFAASMVDGRTVNEAVPKSQSSKEVSDLWLYIQDRLARQMKDPKFSPEFKPQNQAISALSAVDEPVPAPQLADAEPEADMEPEQDMEPERDMEPEQESAVVTPFRVDNENLPPKVWDGTERRMQQDRRQSQSQPVNTNGFSGGAERRLHAFGRRPTERPEFGQAGAKK
jgi:chromosome partitioning protein